jgi:hypothetical protein
MATLGEGKTNIIRWPHEPDLRCLRCGGTNVALCHSPEGAEMPYGEPEWAECGSCGPLGLAHIRSTGSVRDPIRLRDSLAELLDRWQGRLAS